MALKRSEAFILDTRKMGEADQLVVFFTLSDGKVKGIAKSAAKSRRRFGGKLERLSRVRATWFEREGRELARLDSCDLLAESFTLHQELASAAVLGHVAEIADTFAPEHEADPDYFRLLGALLDAFRGMKPGADPLPLARYFEYWTLRLHGLMPDLDLCASCGRALASGAVVLAGASSQALCASCSRAAPRARGERELALSPAALEQLERIRASHPARLSWTAPSGAAAEIEAFTMALMTAFLGHPLHAHRFLVDMKLSAL